MQMTQDTKRFLLGITYTLATVALVIGWFISASVIITKENSGVDQDMVFAWIYTYRMFLLPTVVCWLLAYKFLRSGEPFGLFKPEDYRPPAS